MAYASRATLILVAALAACTEPNGPDTLMANRMKWAVHGPEDYTYRLQISCFCVPAWIQPVHISVRAGTMLTAVRAAATGDPLPPAEAALYQITIDSLFRWVESAIGGAADDVTVEYDAALGYPREVSIDYIASAIDDEIGFSALLVTP
jgi:hypothetical protein